MEFMESIFLTRSCGTHDGSFHADEVTACALLILHDLIDKTKIVRTRNPAKLAECEYVCDVGGIYDPAQKRFDHHQLEYQGSLSSAGMILEHLRQEEVISQGLYDYYNNNLVAGVDAHDNGKTTPQVGHCSFSGVIHNFLPIEHSASDEERDAAFFHAVDFTLGHLQRLKARFTYVEKCKEDVIRQMESNSRVLFFDKALPWIDAFFEHDGETHPAEFIVMPAGVHWKLRAIPPSLSERMKVRKPLPEEWSGLLEKELKDKTGISGAIFCHKGRFISVWETKEDVKRALELMDYGNDIR